MPFEVDERPEIADFGTRYYIAHRNQNPPVIGDGVDPCRAVELYRDDNCFTGPLGGFTIVPVLSSII